MIYVDHRTSRPLGHGTSDHLGLLRNPCRSRHDCNRTDHLSLRRLKGHLPLLVRQVELTANCPSKQYWRSPGSSRRDARKNIRIIKTTQLHDYRGPSTPDPNPSRCKIRKARSATGLSIKLPSRRTASPCEALKAFVTRRAQATSSGHGW